MYFPSLVYLIQVACLLGFEAICVEGCLLSWPCVRACVLRCSAREQTSVRGRKQFGIGEGSAAGGDQACFAVWKTDALQKIRLDVVHVVLRFIYSNLLLVKGCVVYIVVIRVSSCTRCKFKLAHCSTLSRQSTWIRRTQCD